MSQSNTALAVALSALVIVPTALAQLTAHQAVVQMGRGINLGNTLEPETEGGWNNGPAREYYFDDFKSAGFRTVRVPVRWDRHTQSVGPFAVNETWMDRVEEVVDWGLARDLFVIINGHHEDWLKQDYGNPVFRARYDSIWSQIATRFKNKSERLLFEMINEPFGMTAPEVDDLNARILGIIRKTNPTRIVIYSGSEWSGPAQMMAAAIPNDPYMMAYFHTYDPWDFAGLGRGTWGTAADRQAIANLFQSVGDWSSRNNMPVMISEFGSVHAADFNSRMAHYATYVEECLKHGIAFQVWDDGGDFGIYLRNERSWLEAKDILIKTEPDGPTNLRTTVQGDSVVTLAWTNRRLATTISVERAADDDQFQPIAELDGSAAQYADTAIAGGMTYMYRVIARSDRAPEMYSYPIKVSVKPSARYCYHGSPFLIPGDIEAEDYDIGGEGLTYHDADQPNIPGAYRPTEGVDVEARDDGGYQVAYIEAGEWLEYTIDVEEEADYLITAHVASLNGGGQFRYQFSGRFTRPITVPGTNSWQTLTPVMISTPIRLPAGEQIMRVYVGRAEPFNIDRYVLEKASPTSVSTGPADVEVRVFPNPVQNELRIAYGDLVVPEGRIELYNVLGQLVRTAELQTHETAVRLDGVPLGVYFVRVMSGGRLVAQRTVVRQ